MYDSRSPLAPPGATLRWLAPVWGLSMAIAACDFDLYGGADLPDEPAPVVAAVPLATYPHDAGAFTQGLIHHQGFLYESTGLAGRSSLRRIELESGEVVARTDLPAPLFAEGITLFDGKIHQLTLQENRGFIYDPATLERIGEFTFTGEGWGLTTDGTYLIRSNGTSVLLYTRPGSVEIQARLEVVDAGLPITLLNELEWVRDEIWANVYRLDRIARIDPRTGAVKGWIDTSQLSPPIRLQNVEAVANGIAYDRVGDRVFITGKFWPVLYQIAIPE